MSGSRDNVVQHYRTLTPNNVSAAAPLLEGELMVEMAAPQKLWVGVPSSIDPSGRVALVDKSASGTYLPIGGGTLTGPLILAGNPTAALGAATKQYVDTRSPLGGPYLALTGGTLTGPLYLAADPIVPLGAATKQYVDAHVPTGGPFLPLTGGTMTGPLNYTATNATASRSAQDMAGDYLNVKNYGAPLNGTAFDGNAINAALADVRADQGIFFPSGGALIAGVSVIPSTPVHWILDGVTSGTTTTPVQQFQRTNLGDLVENYHNGQKIYWKTSANVDSPGMLRLDYRLDQAGGNAGVISLPIVINAQDNTGAVTSMWGVHVAMDTFSNQGGWPQNVGISSTHIKHGAAWCAGLHITASDVQNLPSSTGGPILGAEIGYHVWGADDAFSGTTWGNVGIRSGVHLSYGQSPIPAAVNGAVTSSTTIPLKNIVGTIAIGMTVTGTGISGSPTVTSIGTNSVVVSVAQTLTNNTALSFTGAAAFVSGGIQVTGDTTTTVQSVLGIGIGTQTYQVLDTRGAVAPAGYGSSVAGLRMLHDQIIDFNGGPALNSVAGNYLQYTTSGTARLRYMDGAAELWSMSDAGAMGLGNYTFTPTGAFSGVAGTNALLLGATSGSKTLILSKGGGTTADDFADVQIVRNTTFTNATSTKQNTALRVSGSVGANDQSRNWLFATVLTTNNTGGGSAVGNYNQVNKIGVGPTYVAGGIFNTQDQTVLASSASSSGGTVGVEIDIAANRADDNSNLQMFGGKGVRIGLDIVGIRYSAADTTQAEISHGIWFSTSLLAGGAPEGSTNFNSAIGFAQSTQTYQALDTRGAIIPTGYASPMAAVRMLHDQIVDFNGGPALNSAAGNYLQYTTTGTARLRYMAGANEVWSVSDAGAWSGTGFGTGIGQIPVFQNYSGSGFSSLGFPTRFIIYKSGATADTDFATVNVLRTTTHTGGAGGAIATALRVSTSINTAVTNQEWALLSAATAAANTSGGAAVGGDFQGIRLANSTVPIWGGIFNAIDQSGNASSVSPGAVLAGEIDIRTSGADDGTNGSVFGGLGLRFGLQFVLTRQATTVDVEASHGLWFSCNEPTHATWKSVIGFAQGTQVFQALDTRGAIPPPSYGSPFASVRMLHDQIIDFNGGAALNSPPGSYLQYTSTGTARLRYMVGASEQFSINNAGVAQATRMQEESAALAANNIDCNAGAFFTKTITANTTFTVSNVPTAGNVPSFVLELTNGGAFTITWWAGVRWPAGVAPALSASGVDVLGFYTLDGGTTWRGMLLGKSMA